MAWGRAAGWVAGLTLVLAAAMGGLALQLAFAVAAFAGLGLAHGASDLEVVACERRAGFVAAYLAVLGGVLAWWLLRPGVALPLFLALSALHFAWEDAPGGGIVPRTIHGLLPIAGPALLHRADLALLLARAGGDAQAGIMIAGVLHWAAVAMLVPLALMIVARRDHRLAAGAAALMLLPPLVGFSLGFLILHALPQSRARADRLGCTGLLAYHARMLPILAGAVGTAAIGAALLVRHDPSGVRVLFAAIAALAVPHMIVTPLFELRGRSARPAAAGRRMVAA